MSVAPIQEGEKGFSFILFSIFNLENLMKKKQLISLEKLEYDVYKNENDIKVKKLITLDEYFKITIIQNKMI